MEKMRQMILPDKFSMLKIRSLSQVSKSTVGFIRFEGELEDRSKLRHVLGRLDGRPIRLAGFSESVKLRASEAKDDFPTRHDWDSFFRDARNMDEMKAGERPDTIHLSNLPIKWFCPRHQENDDGAKPSESIFKRIFEKFGDVRCVDIPICDPYRAQMKSHMSGMQKFSFDQEMYFEGYVQFSEYVGFVKAMDEFRGMKLVRKESDKNLAVTISVEFDRTKHLSDASIKKRKVVRDRLIATDHEKEEQEKKRVAEEEAKKERERKRQEELLKAEELKRMQREQRRKEKHLQKLRQRESDEISLKILQEERKLMETQRKLESIRLLDALFERIKTKQALLSSKVSNALKKETANKSVFNKKADKLKATQEKEMEKMRVRVKSVKDGNLLKNFLGTSGRTSANRSRSPSINSISSDDSILNDYPVDPKKKKKKKKSSSDLSSTTNSDISENEGVEEPQEGTSAVVPYPAAPVAMPPAPYPGMYPGFDWAALGYPYAYDPFYAQRAGYYASAMAYRGFRGAPRGPRYPRSRGRGAYRGRGYENYRDRDDYGDYEYHERDRERDRDRSRTRSYSRSRSRSRSRSHRRRSRSRSRSRSRGRSRSRRSRTRSRSSRSSSRSRSKRRSRTRSDRSRSKSRRSESKSKKLVQVSKPTSKHLASTIRNSRSRTKSRSRTRSRSRYRHRSKHRHRSYTRRTNSKEPEDETVPESFRKHRIVLQTDKLVKSAKEIEEEVREQLRKQQEEEDRNLKEMERSNHKNENIDAETEQTNNHELRKQSKSRSPSHSRNHPYRRRSRSASRSRSNSPVKRKHRKASSRSKSTSTEKSSGDKHRRASPHVNSSRKSRKDQNHYRDESKRSRTSRSHSERSERKRRSNSTDSEKLAASRHRDKAGVYAS
ncbi:A-kinase anchor protein 17A isoform X3 [Wyeomyia smithii]|nr:A-kinase anchor protein 17A isoform X3 [Wyeomyia smithii]